MVIGEYKFFVGVGEMMRKNIFIRDYDVRENILTENFIDFLSNLDLKIINKFLDLAGIKTKIKDINDVNFDMQQREGKSIPDASVYDAEDFYIHIESKVVKETIRELQLEGHFNGLKNKSQKKKILLVITNDYEEPAELKRFKKTHKGKEIKIKFLNWGQIRDFVNKIPKNIVGERDKFLIKQYNEYLEGEKMAISQWSGFKKGDKNKWEDYINWYDNLEKILDIIRGHIKAEKEDWDVSGIVKNSDNLYFGAITWRKRKRRGRCHIGVEYKPIEAGSKNIYFYVQWHWSRRLITKLLKRHSGKFNKIKDRLKRNGYKPDLKASKFGNNDFYKSLYFEDIMKKDDSSGQKRLIFNFIDKAIRNFEACGLKQLIEKL